jgi:LemA protein
MNKVEMFPSNIIASMFGFKEMKYFEAEEEAKTAPKVSF